MRRIPITRFRREMNQHMRSKETITLTRCGVDVLVWMPEEEYRSLAQELEEGIKQCIEHSKGNLELKTTTITRDEASCASFKAMYGRGNDEDD